VQLREHAEQSQVFGTARGAASSDVGRAWVFHSDVLYAQQGLNGWALMALNLDQRMDEYI